METRPEESPPEEPLEPAGMPGAPGGEPSEEPKIVVLPPDEEVVETPPAAEEVVQGVTVEETLIDAPASEEPIRETVMETTAGETVYEAAPPPPPPPGTYAAGVLAQDSEDRTWSMVAHLSVLLNLVTGILGPIVAFVIYLVYKDRSRYIAYQSMQSFVFQLICWVGAGLVIAGMWILQTLLLVLIVPLLCIPFTLILTVILLALPIISLIYGVVGAVETSQGKDFRYLWVGDWVRGILEP